MLEQVLTVRGAETHTAHHTNKVSIEAVDAQFDDRALADFDDLLLQLLAGFGHHFLNAGRVNTAIGHQLLQRQAGDFTADRVEAGNNDGLRRIVHDDFSACGGFQRPDVTAFAANDLAFHVVGFKLEHRDRIFDGEFRGHPLDGLDDNFLGFFAGVELGLGDGFFHERHGIGFRFAFDGFEQLLLGLALRQASRCLRAP